MLWNRIIEAQDAHDSWKPSPEERAAFRQFQLTGHTPKGFHFVFGRLLKIGGAQSSGFKPKETKPKFATKSDPDMPLFNSPKKSEPSSAPKKDELKPVVSAPKKDDWKDHWKDWKPKEEPPRPKRSPDEQKIHDLAKSLRGKPLKRSAAGGLVFKNFNAPSVEDLQVLVAKTHPKWGSYWVIPKGGADQGEHIHDTAARETEEETGVKAKVIPQHEPFVKSSTFGESGKYDLPLVVKALKDAHPEQADFIEKHKDKLNHESFTIENNSHYFLMQHTGGEPISHPDQSHDEEMSEARFMPIKEAMKLGSKVADVIHGLMPTIKKQWEASKGDQVAAPATKAESLLDRVRR